MSLKKAFREHRLHGARSAAPGASRAVLACPAARAELWGRTGGPASDAQPGLCPSPESPRSAHALSATSHNDNRCPLGGLFSGAPSPSGCYLVFVVVVVVFEWPVRQGAVRNLLTASLVEKRRPTGLSDSAGTETSSPPPAPRREPGALVHECRSCHRAEQAFPSDARGAGDRGEGGETLHATQPWARPGGRLRETDEPPPPAWRGSACQGEPCLAKSHTCGLTSPRPLCLQVDPDAEGDAGSLRRTVRDLLAKLQEAERQQQSDRVAFEVSREMPGDAGGTSPGAFPARTSVLPAACHRLPVCLSLSCVFVRGQPVVPGAAPAPPRRRRAAGAGLAERVTPASPHRVPRRGARGARHRVGRAGSAGCLAQRPSSGPDARMKLRS